MYLKLTSLFLLLFVIGCSGNESDITGQVIYNLNDSNKVEVVVADPAPQPEEALVREERIKQTVKICSDTDNGQIRWEKGTVRGFYNNATNFEFIDYCQNFNHLIEFWCDEEDPKQERFFCRNGCEDGSCR